MDSNVVVVCGSRGWDNHKAIRDVLQRLPKNTVIRTGGAKGADLIAEHHANRLGLKVEPSFRPDYEQYGRRATFIRNTEMLKTHPKPYKVIAFWDGVSSGTHDTLKKACSRDIPVEIYIEGNVNHTFEGKGDVHIEVNV